MIFEEAKTLDDTIDKVNIVGSIKSISINNESSEAISIKINYEWICQEILNRIKYPDVQDVIRILRELDAEQENPKK